MVHGLKALHVAQVVVPESRIASERIAEVRPEEVRPDELRLDEERRAEVGPVKVRLGEVRHAEVHPAEVRPEEVRPVQVRPVELRPAEVRQTEVRPAEVRLAETRDCFGVCLSPVIPSSYIFQDSCEMFTVRHGASLSLALIINPSGHRAIARSDALSTFVLPILRVSRIMGQ